MKLTYRLACAAALLGAFLLGCSNQPAKEPAKPAVKAKHDHPEDGPHKGPLAEWGAEEFHPEFTVDHQKQEARVYVLGPDAKTPAPIKTERILLTIYAPAFQVDLKPEPQPNDPPGTASCFVGKHEKLGEDRSFAGTLSAEINGKPYAGDFKEGAHHHEGHSHSKK